MKRTLAAVLIGLAASAASITCGAAEAPVGANARPASLDRQAVEGRIVNVNEHVIQLDDGTVIRVPEGLVAQADLRAGRALRLSWETKGGENVATALEFLDTDKK